TPPSISGLAGKAADGRNGARSPVLVIIASYNDEKRLAALLDSLAKQQFSNFDVAIIYGKGDHFVRHSKLRILHIERKTDLGFAGAVYLGQLIALRDKYKYFLATDVDKLPFKGALKALYGASEARRLDYARGRFVFSGIHVPPDNIVPFKQEVLPHGAFTFLWGLVRTDILIKTGLYAAPLYMGCDDTEFSYRLRLAGARQEILGEWIFRTYYPVMRLLRLARKGGYDRTDACQRALSLRQMPQIFLFQPGYKAMETLARMLLVTLPYIYQSNLYFRLMEQRVPEFGKYRACARRSLFRSPFWGAFGDEMEITGAGAAKMRPMAELQTKFTMKMLAQALMLFFNKRTDAFPTELFMALPDTCIMPDETGEKLIKITWRRRIPIPKKLLLAAYALFDTLECMARACFNAASGRHLFKDYALP
ncbi:MAG: glycosyltransferase, partial [Candidatus Micrarchaeia archaeon]